MSVWHLVTNWGIMLTGDQTDPGATYHAGNVRDVLRVGTQPTDPLLVAADSSGVWLADESGGVAIPLSTTWPLVQTRALAHGIHGDRHVFAAGDALFETDTTTAAPLFNWRQIIIRDARDTVLGTGMIHRAIVVRERSKIILACDNGIFWATIPPAGGHYVFTQAPLPPGRRFSGLAEGPNTSVVIAAWGTDLGNHFGIFNADWSGPGGSLVVTGRATITGSVKDSLMQRIDLGVCTGDRRFMYAVCGGGPLTRKTDANGNPVPPDPFGNVIWTTDDFLYRVLRSTDGGLTWHVTGTAIDGTTDPLFGGTPAQDHGGLTQGGYNLCVGVSPFDPNLVAIGLRNFFVSKDGGKNWQLFTRDMSAHLHEDTHGLVFDPTDPAHIQLLVGSDGGLATTPDLGKTWTTAANRQLPNLQFNRFAPSQHDAGLIAGSLQDNGNLFTPLYVNADPWRRLDGGDGVLTLFLNPGDLIRENNTLTGTDPSGVLTEYGRKARAAEWEDAKRRFHDLQMFPYFPLSIGVIPVDGTNDGLANDPVTDQTIPNANVTEVVTAPAFTNPAGERLLAVGAVGEAVYGLFPVSGGTYHWQRLTNVPHLPPTDGSGNPLPYFATATASLDGNSVLVGMNDGKVFRLDAPLWAATNLTDPVVSLPITRFAIVSPGRAFLIAGAAVFRRETAGWKQVTAEPNGLGYVVLEADHTSAAASHVFVASPAGVWESEDDGATWTDTKADLPRMPNCTDLRFARESSGATFMYVGTFGWSAFRKLLNYEDVTQNVTINGHMDLVDREAFGKDHWAHPTFAHTFTLGPFHPIEEITYTEDDDDELRVILKLHLEWKIDRSVVVTHDATLIDRENDDETDDHDDGSLTVAFGATGTKVIDMKSDEWWPDRAHIEFVVTN
jgi:photosystem II stability/assembly factor-like uncharacterized protein